MKGLPAWCLGGYLLLLFVTLPAAWPVWTGFLRDRIGRFVTIEIFHILEYAALGVLAGWTFRSWALTGAGRFFPLVLIFLVGWTEEIAQGLLPQRYFQWSDVLLNWAGTLLGFFVEACWQGIVRSPAGWVGSTRIRSRKR